MSGVNHFTKNDLIETIIVIITSLVNIVPSRPGYLQSNSGVFLFEIDLQNVIKHSQVV